MSDFEEQATRKMASHLSRIYSGLATVCLNLPVAVTLPTGAISNVEAVPAVRRVMAIVEDQPMPVQQQATLFAVCAFWLGALDLYGLVIQEGFDVARAHSVAANILMAEDHLHDITVWLADTQK
ncbi:hypothetical protein ABTZ57_01375 [Streptomyces sp. NPDC094048]|uniref:hypothetical protein n=1 Tax=unclassified Streptomyces TaxID=2593676 RepID=UPI00332B652A